MKFEYMSNLKLCAGLTEHCSNPCELLPFTLTNKDK